MAFVFPLCYAYQMPSYSEVQRALYTIVNLTIALMFDVWYTHLLFHNDED